MQQYRNGRLSPHQYALCCFRLQRATCFFRLYLFVCICRVQIYEYICMYTTVVSNISVSIDLLEGHTWSQPMSFSVVVNMYEVSCL